MDGYLVVRRQGLHVFVRQPRRLAVFVCRCVEPFRGTFHCCAIGVSLLACGGASGGPAGKLALAPPVAKRLESLRKFSEA